MKFLSLCSGIEAASVAWNPLGWEAVAFSEIEPFPCALLAHKYPNVPNLGDMNNYEDWPDDLAIDLLCGGTPCQSFSSAGLRKGLADPRGNLMLVFASIAAKYRPRWLVWENVPGVLSSNGGRDFAAFLGLLTGQKVSVPPGGWGKAGFLSGIASAYGVAYRVLDAQYFGLAQRRERVFVIGYLGDWRAAAAVLLERQGLQGDPAPSRGQGEGAAAGALRSTDGGSDVDHARAGHLIAGTIEAAGGRSRGAGISPAVLVPEISGTLTSNGKAATTGTCQGAFSSQLLPVQCFGGNNTAGPIDVAPAVRAHGSFHGDFESEAFLVAQPIPLLEVGKRTGRNYENMRDGVGIGAECDPSFTLQANAQHGVCAPIVFKASHYTRGKDGALSTTAPSLTADADKGDQDNLVLAFQAQMSGTQTATGGGNVSPTLSAVARMAVAQPAMAVRRFTPLECERLQGFPDWYTLVPYRPRRSKDFFAWVEYLSARILGMTAAQAEQLAADGPRYKAIGNSWAIPCVRWIGERIEMVEQVLGE